MYHLKTAISGPCLVDSSSRLICKSGYKFQDSRQNTHLVLGATVTHHIPHLHKYTERKHSRELLFVVLDVVGALPAIHIDLYLPYLSR